MEDSYERRKDHSKTHMEDESFAHSETPKQVIFFVDVRTDQPHLGTLYWPAVDLDRTWTVNTYVNPNWFQLSQLSE